jgi:hypothetical protein
MKINGALNITPGSGVGVRRAGPKHNKRGVFVATLDLPLYPVPYLDAVSVDKAARDFQNIVHWLR